jgi:short-subunit dehydrogenase
MSKESGPVVVITGGTGGLGQALAAHYLRSEAQVVVTGRSEAKLKAMKKSCGSPKHLHIYKLDVTDNEAVRAFCAWVQIRFGRCDLLYNNAGAAVFKPFSEMNLQEVEQTLGANINGLLFVTRAFLPMMLSAGGGHIVNIASLAGRVATAKAAVYAASKAAVIRFSEALRHELADRGIHVTCVLPGPMDTPFLDAADHTGLYREKVRHYLLSPEKAATIIVRSVNAKKPEVALPYRLHVMSLLYSLLPNSAKRLFAPLLNRK